MTDIQEETNKAGKGEIRTILLVGASGSGKSTLGNVLVNRNGNFEEVFVESEYNVSETKNIKSVKVEIDGINYNLIDTPGFCDTSFEVIKIPPTLGELDKYIRLGIDYVLFMVNKRFTSKDLDIFEYLKEIFFKDDVVKYITIIFTNFPRFREKERCEKDIERLRNESESIADIINNVKIIHVNNAPFLDDEDVSSKRAREDSRKRILNHLKLYQNEENCKPRSGDLHERIKKLNEADLTKMKKYHNEIGEWVEKIRIFIEWRKNIKEEINNYLENLVSHVKNCEVTAGNSRYVSLLGKGLTGIKLPIGIAIHVAGNTFEFGTRFVEIIIEKIYCDRISNRIEKDKEKRLLLLRKDLRNQISEYHELLNINPTKIIENLSLRSLFADIKAAFDKLCTLVEERMNNDNDNNSESNENSEFNINVTDQCESNEVKGYFITVINKIKALLNSRLQEDHNLLDVEQNHLQESYNESEYEIEKLEAKLEKENLAFLLKAQIEVHSKQD
ncbi:hypothetical protein RclHR1_00390023 [Rhizophagus clarus]|uniref:P-loop containing nucleoside triphosphate hydrolase protein n=1 Tax=Rhizophagus clarus TaxID=94130 RepID=A0A2Z6S8D1_9GLOM|nr:hypothetical protein RclHR1_00390023 [Rhizophagus clarus]GET02197.1 P-loop containing nucleoside triphosphate hydrolase protein [Rhizophagus clarus]